MSLAFRYRAATSAGQVVEGEVRAGTMLEAREQIRRQDLVPVSLEPASGAAPSVRRTRNASLAPDLRALATLVSAGQSLERALRFLAEQGESEATRRCWQSILDGVREGRSLSEAMAAQPRFSAFAVSVVRAGEEGGVLDEGLARLAKHAEDNAELSRDIRSALLYPALMAAVTGVGAVTVLTVAVPRFMAVLGATEGSLPLATRALVGVSSALVHGWWILLAVLAAGIMVARTLLQDMALRMRWHAARLRLPLAGRLERDLAAARYCRSLGVMLDAGVPLMASLDRASSVVTNAALSDALNRGSAAVARGEGIADSIGVVLPPMARHLLRAGEESGQLGAMCLRIAGQLDDDVRSTLRDLVRVIEPAMIVVFGGIVGFMALALLQAMYSVRPG